MLEVFFKTAFHAFEVNRLLAPEIAHDQQIPRATTWAGNSQCDFAIRHLDTSVSYHKSLATR
jgi:hypothetical protein